MGIYGKNAKHEVTLLQKKIAQLDQSWKCTMEHVDLRHALLKEQIDQAEKSKENSLDFSKRLLKGFSDRSAKTEEQQLKLITTFIKYIECGKTSETNETKKINDLTKNSEKSLNTAINVEATKQEKNESEKHNDVEKQVEKSKVQQPISYKKKKRKKQK